MTGLVLDLIELRRAVGIDEPAKTNETNETNESAEPNTPEHSGDVGELEELRDEIAKGCFTDPGHYQGCEAYIRSCWTQARPNTPTPSSTGIDCSTYETNKTGPKLRVFIEKKSSSWEETLRESEATP